MCNLNGPIEDFTSARELKRKRPIYDLGDIIIPPKRISPFLNTPKENRETAKKVLNISLQKLKHLENANEISRKSVLIKNTMKRLQKEIRTEKKKGYSVSCISNNQCGLNNNCLSGSFLLEDPFLSGIQDKITDDMTDTLLVNLENTLGVNISSVSSKSAEFQMHTFGQTTIPHSGQFFCDSSNAKVSLNSFVCDYGRTSENYNCSYLTPTNCIAGSFNIYSTCANGKDVVAPLLTHLQPKTNYSMLMT